MKIYLNNFSNSLISKTNYRIINNYYRPNTNYNNSDSISFTSENPLDEYWGGYNKEKNKLFDILISRINNKNKLPPSVLISCPDKYMISCILEGIFKTADANFVECSYKDNDLSSNLISEIKKAKNYYDNTGKKTIIILNDAENIIGMTPAYAHKYSIIPLDKEDYSILEGQKQNIGNINFFKSLLDNPNAVNKSTSKMQGNFVTILFTTSKPQYIHPDLLSREGKISTIIFSNPQKSNIKNTIKYEAEKARRLLNFVKYGAIWNMQELEPKTRSKVYRSKNLYKLNLDIDKIPYEKIVKFAKYNKKNGAFSYEQYHQIAIKSLNDYIKHPKIPFSYYYLYNIMTTKRGVSIKEYSDYEGMKLML